MVFACRITSPPCLRNETQPPNLSLHFPSRKLKNGGFLLSTSVYETLLFGTYNFASFRAMELKIIWKEPFVRVPTLF